MNDTRVLRARDGSAGRGDLARALGRFTPFLLAFECLGSLSPRLGWRWLPSDSVGVRVAPATAGGSLPAVHLCVFSVHAPPSFREAAVCPL